MIPVANITEIVPQDTRPRRTRRCITGISTSTSAAITGISTGNNTATVAAAAAVGKKTPSKNKNIDVAPALVTPPTSPHESPPTNVVNDDSITFSSSSRSNNKSNKKSKKPTSSPSLSLSSSEPQPKIMEYAVTPVKSVSYEKNSTVYFLKAFFDGNLLVLQEELNGERQTLEKVKNECGIKYHLVVSKLRDNNAWQHHSSMKHYETMVKDCCIAYYLGGPGFETVEDVKMKLEALGNFRDISLLSGKMCARLELLVCPPTSQYPNIFELKADDFEEVEENQHEGENVNP